MQLHLWFVFVYFDMHITRFLAGENSPLFFIALICHVTDVIICSDVAEEISYSNYFLLPGCTVSAVHLSS